MHACMLSRFSCVQLFATLWTIAHQAPLSMGISCPPPRDLPDPGIKPMSPVASALQANSLPLSSTFREAQFQAYNRLIWCFYTLWMITSLYKIVTISLTIFSVCNYIFVTYILQLKLVPLNPHHPSSPHVPFIFSPLETTTLFSVSMNLFLFCLVFQIPHRIVIMWDLFSLSDLFH